MTQIGRGDMMQGAVIRRGERPIVADDSAAIELVKWLRGEQDNQGWTDQEMASELGVSRGYWSSVVAWADGRGEGWRLRPGLTFLSGVVARYPEWKDRIRAMLRPEVAALS